MTERRQCEIHHIYNKNNISSDTVCTIMLGWSIIWWNHSVNWYWNVCMCACARVYYLLIFAGVIWYSVVFSGWILRKSLCFSLKCSSHDSADPSRKADWCYRCDSNAKCVFYISIDNIYNNITMVMMAKCSWWWHRRVYRNIAGTIWGHTSKYIRGIQSEKEKRNIVCECVWGRGGKYRMTYHARYRRLKTVQSKKIVNLFSAMCVSTFFV